VSRAELLTDVWDQPGSLTTRTVDNFVMRLRKNFERDPADPKHFLSVRGAGYRFVAKPEESPPTDASNKDDASPDDGAVPN
jgi:two-component system OmpR family response regulator